MKPRLIVLATLTSILAPAAGLAAPVAWYRFDGTPGPGAGTVIDSVNALNGTANGSPTYVADVPALRPGLTDSTSMAMDSGSGPGVDQVTVADDPLLRLVDDFTVETFFKGPLQSGHGVTSYPKLVHKQAGYYLSGNANYLLELNANYDPANPGSTNSMVWRVTRSGGSVHDDVYVYTNIFDNQWHSLVGTKGGDKMRLYLDGYLYGTVSSPGNAETSPTGGSTENALMIGSPSQPFYGSVDETRISTGVLEKRDFLAAVEIYPSAQHYWRFEAHENWSGGYLKEVDDSGGRTAHGVVSGGVTVSADVAPFYTPADSYGIGNTHSLYFDGGAGSYLQVPGTEPALAISGDLTLEAFVRLPSDWDPSGYPKVVFGTTGEPGGQANYLFEINGSSNRVFFRVTTDSDGVNRDTPGLDIVDGQWHHLAGVREGDALRFYVDGSLVGTTTGLGTGALRAPTSILMGSQNFRGWIDEVRLTARALGPDEFLTRVPEPASWLLLALGGLAMAVARRRARGPARRGWQA
jgi:hypothetical protein